MKLPEAQTTHNLIYSWLTHTLSVLLQFSVCLCCILSFLHFIFCFPMFDFRVLKHFFSSPRLLLNFFSASAALWLKGFESFSAFWDKNRCKTRQLLCYKRSLHNDPSQTYSLVRHRFICYIHRESYHYRRVSNDLITLVQSKSLLYCSIHIAYRVTKLLFFIRLKCT